MKRFLTILAFLFTVLLVGCVPAEASEDSPMAPTNPLLQFEGPRRAYNADEYSVTPSAVTLIGEGTQLLSNVLLGAGLTVTTVPASPAPGAPQYSVIASPEISVLRTRIEALERRQYVVTDEKTEDYTAAPWEHVLINLTGVPPTTITITMPADAISGDRVRISEVSVGGGTFANITLHVECTWANVTGGYYANTTPYLIAPDGDGFSRVGATIELEYIGTGWVILQESYQPARP